LIRHLVLWKLTPAALEQGRDEVLQKLRASARNMVGKIPGLIKSEVALNLAQNAHLAGGGHDLIFYCEFETAAAIPAYLIHPLHEAHKSMAAAWVENRETVDVEANNDFLQ
jgi:hypothetical protein